MGKQLLRSGTSVAARVGVVVEEADESVFWLEMLADNGIIQATRIEPLLNEAKELTAIFTASQETAKRSRV